MIKQITIMKRAFYAILLLAIIFLSSFTKPEGGENDSKTEKISATFVVQSFKISKDGMVSWTAVNEHGSLPYLVEQFIFDKWVKVGEVLGIGSPTPNSYSVPVI